MPENKWRGFESPSYKLLDLGRPACFLVPVNKLETPYEGTTIRDDLEDFLIDTFGGFHIIEKIYGIWRDETGQKVRDECVMFEVSFLGKEHIPVLLDKLNWISQTVGEKCVYVKAGQYTSLLEPSS